MMQSLPGENETAAVASAQMADQGSIDQTASFRVAENRARLVERGFLVEQTDSALESPLFVEGEPQCETG